MAITYRCDGIIRDTGKDTAIAVSANDTDEAVRIANEHGVMVDSARPDSTAIFCPYCFTIFPGGVPLVGQTVVCSRCCATVTMPDTTGRATNAAIGQLIMAILGVVVGLILLVRGCALWNLGEVLSR